jgi:hypothetical protein
VLTASNKRRQVLTHDGTIDHFELFGNNVEVNYGQISTGYLSDSSFQESYFEKGVGCYVAFLDELSSASQIKKGARTLYSALFSACQSGVGWKKEMRKMAFVHSTS